jgi:hypothetical protein
MRDASTRFWLTPDTGATLLAKKPAVADPAVAAVAIAATAPAKKRFFMVVVLSVRCGGRNGSAIRLIIRIYSLVARAAALALSPR